MLISVIIATKNEERNIENCLKSVLAQTYPRENIEIVVVDNDSTDRTLEIIDKSRERLAPLDLKVFNRGPERSAQRNFGMEKSKGECFLYLDADMTLNQGVIKECVEKIQSDENTVGLYIPEKIAGSGFWVKVRNFERSFYDGTAIDGLRFIRKNKFLEVGGFDENLYACEDWDLDKRLKVLGKTDIIRNPLYHNESEFSLKKYLAKKKYYSKNIDVYIKKWGKNDPDVRKQFGFCYRYFWVFVENGKWKKMLRHPVLMLGVYFLRFLVGVEFLLKRF